MKVFGLIKSYMDSETQEGTPRMQYSGRVVLVNPDDDMLNTPPEIDFEGPICTHSNSDNEPPTGSN